MNRNIDTFEWDHANIAHIAKHKVLPKEAEQIFLDRNQVFQEDKKHSRDKEKRTIIIGKTEQGRLLYQVFTIRMSKIRVISSRDLNKKEVNLYEKTTSGS